MRHFRKVAYTNHEFFNGQHRFEHWYRNNTVYFLTSRVRDGVAVFQERAARDVFWTQFDHYTKLHGFVPWVTSLLNNHYHTLGYLRDGEQPGEMMRKLHGSVAWLVMKETGVR